jgi:hypothetical protein
MYSPVHFGMLKMDLGLKCRTESFRAFDDLGFGTLHDLHTGI